MQQIPAGDREVFRSGGGVVLWWVWLAIAAFTLVDLVVQGRGQLDPVVVLVVAAITGGVYACALRPRIIADQAGITIVNPLRDHRVPWRSVISVDLVNTVRVHCAAPPGEQRGKIVHSWAVQSSVRAERRAQSRARRASRRPGVSGLPRPRGLPGAPGSGYGKYPGEIQQALDRSAAEFAANELNERAQRLRQAQADEARQTSEADETAAPEARWAWGPIAAMVLPGLALLVVLLVT